MGWAPWGWRIGDFELTAWMENEILIRNGASVERRKEQTLCLSPGIWHCLPREKIWNAFQKYLSFPLWIFSWSLAFSSPTSHWCCADTRGWGGQRVRPFFPPDQPGAAIQSLTICPSHVPCSFCPSPTIQSPFWGIPFSVCMHAQLLSCVQLLWPPWTVALLCPWDFPREEYWSGLPFPFPGESYRPRDRTCVSCISCIGRQILYPCATWEPYIPGQKQTRKLEDITHGNYCNGLYWLSLLSGTESFPGSIAFILTSTLWDGITVRPPFCLFF